MMIAECLDTSAIVEKQMATMTALRCSFTNQNISTEGGVLQSEPNTWKHVEPRVSCWSAAPAPSNEIGLKLRAADLREMVPLLHSNWTREWPQMSNPWCWVP